MRVSVATRLNELMATKGINLKQLSALCGIKYTTLNNYATGIRQPQIDTLCAISEATQTDIRWLVGYELEKRQ